MIIGTGLHSQIKELASLEIEEYKFDHLSYEEVTPIIETKKLSDNSIILVSQNGSFLKINPQGNMIWKKEIEEYSQIIRIVIDSKNHITIVYNTQIEKYNSDGVLVWKKEFRNELNKKFPKFKAITVDKEDNYYLTGNYFNTNYIFISKIDKNGNVIWNKDFKQKLKNKYHFIPPKEIVFLNNDIYILCKTPQYLRSRIYATNNKGSNRKELKLDYRIDKIKAKDDKIFAIGDKVGFDSKIIVSSYDSDLNTINAFGFNIDADKLIQHQKLMNESIDQDFKHILNIENRHKSFFVSDFIIDSNNSFIIVGTSNDKSALIKLSQTGELIWYWENVDSSYFKIDEVLKRSQKLSSINLIDENIISITGVNQEKYETPNRILLNINLFLKIIEMSN